MRPRDYAAEQLGKRRPRYSDAELFVIRRSFNRGRTDDEIAHQLRTNFGRECHGEAIRKIRRRLKLKKVPTLDRWTWGVETWPGSEVSYG